jgi:uncharacterized protein (TIGR02453 family)
MNASTLEFLRELRKNNSKLWFENNRHRYEEARADFLRFFEELVHEIAKFDRHVLRNPEEAKKVFRIYRDLRFSRDKSPYKAHLAGVIVPGGMQSGRAGYYAHIEPGGLSMAAGGMHQPDSKNLQKVRKALSVRVEEFRSIVEEDSFIAQFTSLNRENVLKRVPPGFDPSDPAAEYLKLKSFTVRKAFTDDEVLQESFTSDMVSAFRTVKNLNDFLDSAL